MVTLKLFSGGKEFSRKGKSRKLNWKSIPIQFLFKIGYNGSMIRTGKKFSKPELSKVINGDTILPEVEAKPEKIRLDVLAKEFYKSYNRSTLQKFIESGFMSVDGEVVTRPSAKYERGVKLDLKVPEVMKNDHLHLPYSNDLYGKHSFFVP